MTEKKERSIVPEITHRVAQLIIVDRKYRVALKPPKAQEQVWDVYSTLLEESDQYTYTKIMKHVLEDAKWQQMALWLLGRVQRLDYNTQSGQMIQAKRAFFTGIEDDLTSDESTIRLKNLGLVVVDGDKLGDHSLKREFYLTDALNAALQFTEEFLNAEQQDIQVTPQQFFWQIASDNPQYQSETQLYLQKNVWNGNDI